jgi:hypothetical protein
MTIQEIKRLSSITAPYYFSKSSLKFFGQRMSDFKIKKQTDGRFLISAPMRNSEGKVIGKSERYFNPMNNKLEIV